MTSLINKYRPQTFAEVIGQSAVVRSLKTVIKKRTSHAFLFTGPSGTGKTTLGRIIANELGATDPKQVREFDAATNTGIDDVRAIMETLRYKPIGTTPIRVMIIDECHALSSAAWKALLKVLEEPPEWIIWILCTTEPLRVPPTIKTRCAAYGLVAVDKQTMYEWLSDICEKENILQGEEGERIVNLCVKEAYGSPRQALSNLATCEASKTKAEAAGLLASADATPEAIELAKLLMNRGTWLQAQQLLVALKDTSPESIRQTVRAYITKAALGADKEAQWAYRLKVLSAFSEPCFSGDGITPILLATARAMFT